MSFYKKFKNRRHSLWYHSSSVLCRFLLPFLQKIGLNLTVHHYYSPIPDIKETSKLFNKLQESSKNIEGLTLSINEHIIFIEKVSGYIDEFYRSDDENILNNNSFRSVDAEIFYSIIRHNKPGKIIEIGGGVSSKIIVKALKLNRSENFKCNYLCIEPFPTKELIKSLNGFGELIVEKIENIDVSVFENLGEKDILFIDSSHVVKPFNDVYFEFFKILPKIKKGVFVHFHDIYLPAEYPLKNIAKHHYFWNEQYLLHSFLLCNDSFKIIWGGSFAHLNSPELLERYFKSYDKQKEWPGSFWLEKIK